MSDRYILQDGQPVLCDDLLEWARWYEDARLSRARAVRQTRVWADGSTEDLSATGEAQREDNAACMVSTVFLALDHNFSGYGPPVLWETMVFGGPQIDEWQERYSSRADAEEGHREMVARVIEALKQTEDV